MYERILVGTDGSVSATGAVRRAVELGRATGGEILVAFIGSNQAGGPVLEQALAPYPDDDIATITREGDPATMLVTIAKQKDVDCIVVGNKGMQGAQRFLVGSVPNKVSHNAPCDVLIVATEG